MPTYSQAGRLISVTTPLGADKLLLEKLRSEEAMSEPFRLSLEVLCKRSDAFDFDALLGQAVTAKVQLPDDSFRYHNGIVAEVEESDQKQGGTGVELLRYRLAVVPRLWVLGLNRKSMLFQQMTVPDILKKVLVGFEVSWQMEGTYEPRDYCTQYRESDLAFASRLMEEEGIFYYFKHAEGSHTMVVGDKPAVHAAVPGPATVSFQPGEGGLHPDARIRSWSRKQGMRAGKATLWDQCFELPGQNLEATDPVLATVVAGTKTHKLEAGPNAAIELYDYPGLFAQRFDGTAPGGGDRASDVQKIFQDNARTVKLRMQEETARAVVIEGAGNVRHLCAGCTFTLSDHFNANGEYVLTRTRFEASIVGSYEGSGQADVRVDTTFECIPRALPFRPRRRTPRPVIAGPQTAVVVGPSGQEIFTDKYGRIKVQFPWDRDGKKDAASSCWIRVGTPWAGKQWGMIHLPRIGQEVVVAFEDGDPDRPLVVGSVYNADQMPPYLLPDNMTQSGLKTRSSMEGTAENFNELRFEDKKGEEQVYFHAEKNFDRVVENNDTLKVGFEKKDKGDQTLEIFNNQTVKIGAGAGQAADGSQTLEIYKDRTTSLETGHDTLTIKKGNQVTKVELGSSSLEAKQFIELKVGQNFIKIDQTGITMQGVVIKIMGQAQILSKAPAHQVMGDAILILKGGQLVLG